MTVSQIKAQLREVADAERAKIAVRFFKTGKGEYGEGDRFLGVVTPAQRKIAKRYFAAREFSSVRSTLSVVDELLQSEFHEERFTALLILVEQYRRSDDAGKRDIFDFYLKHLGYVNSWDLVDVSAPGIVGAYLLDRDPSLLIRLAKSKIIWTRRVAVLATFPFIKSGRFAETLALAERLLIEQKDPHDLMHKAVGWMLREVGKRDQKVLEEFLDRCAARLPRTALRYAIEKFPEAKRQKYLALGKSSKK